MRGDYAAQYRRDFRLGWPPEMIISSLRSTLASLKTLPNKTEDRDQAISDVENFLKELENIGKEI